MLHVLTGLFTTFTFYHLGYASIDFQSRLFAVFMTLTISPPLIQQLQPVFLNSRNIFQSRENKAKIYSWTAWTTGAVLAEIPYSIVAGTVYYCCWWFGFQGYRHSTTSFTSGFLYLCICLFELYYVSFGQAIAAFSPNELLASLLVPVFFLFVVSFCGVVVPPQQLPAFWHDFMYWLTPFHYLLEAMLGVSFMSSCAFSCFFFFGALCLLDKAEADTPIFSHTGHYSQPTCTLQSRRIRAFRKSLPSLRCRRTDH